MRGDLFAVVILAVYVLIATIAFNAGRDSERRTYQPHQHAMSAANSARLSCRDEAGDDLIKCIFDEVANSDEIGRAEQDLKAQQEMALWALLMFITSSFTLAATVWALIYVKGTLDETKKMTVDTKRMADEADRSTAAALLAAKAGRDANDLSRMSNERQLRAYVGVEEEAVIDFASGQRPTFRCKIWNRGQTPAYDVRVWSVVQSGIGDPSNYKVFSGGTPEQFSSATIGPGQWLLHATKSQGTVDEDVVIKISSGELFAIFSGVVTYRTAFGKLRRTTFKSFLRGDGSLLSPAVDLLATKSGNVAN